MDLKRPKKMLLLVCLLFLPLLQGCWGVRETDELAYVLTIGLDKGKNNVLMATFQIAIPQPAEGGGGEESSEVISVEAASIFGALQLANAFVSKDLTFIHNRVVVVSADIAREGLSKYINPLIRSREIRRNTYLLVTEGTAKDFMEKNKPVLEKNPSRQFEMLLDTGLYTGFLPISDIHEFSINYKSPGSDPYIVIVGVNEDKIKDDSSVEKPDLPTLVRQEVAFRPGQIPREGGNKVEVMGLAAFQGDKLTGYLNGAETRYFQMVNGGYNSAIFTFPDPEMPEEYIIVIKIKKGRNPSREVKFIGDKVVLTAELILEGEILSIQSGIDYETGEKAKLLQTYLENYINDEATKVIKRTQTELRSDIFGFGEATRKYFWTWQEWEELNWSQRYLAADVQVKTRVDIRRTGLMGRTTDPRR